MNQRELEIKIAETVERICQVDETLIHKAKGFQDTLTKPSRSLGSLEDFGNRISAIVGKCPPDEITKSLVVVFAADHGCAAKTSPWPQEVTTQMAVNIVNGGAAVSVLARHAGADLKLVDMGMLQPLSLANSDKFQDCRIKNGTDDLTVGPAMTKVEALQSICVGIDLANQAAQDGYQILIPGEVGIGNTSPAALLVSALTGVEIAEVTGRGSDPTGNKFERKIQALKQALAVNQPDPSNPLEVLAKVGGLEHGAIVGLILGGAANRLPVLLDGVICCSSALVAVKICAEVKDYLLAGHLGSEPGIRHCLESLGLKPVLQLGMCLGEGSGAVAALPVVQASVKVMTQMATFDSANVTSEHE